jgi:hypothetical protein
METNNNILKKINDLTAAYKEFLRDESRYSLKKNLLELCEKYRITPRELSDFIEEVDIEHDQTSTVSVEKVNEEEDEDEEGNSIHAKEIVELAEVVDEQPDEDKCYPPGWSN